MTGLSFKKIGTHSGTFHADEVLACAMLRILSPESQIVRTRDESLLKNCDIVVDVGGVYSHTAKRYDHHQRGFEECFSKSFSTKLSSAGLVYKHYGKQVISSILKMEDTEKVDTIFDRIYKQFIEAFDGIDNGIDRYPKDVKSKYNDYTNISSLIGGMNGTWVEPEDQQDVRFKEALEFMTKIFKRTIVVCGTSWLPARELVLNGLLTMKNQTIVFDEYVPWKSHFYELEEELLKSKKLKKKALFVVYPTGDTWRVTCVSVSETSFENRLSLPEQWRGLRDSELDKVTKLSGCTFVHASGFTGGNKSKDNLMKMVEMALAENK